MISNQRTAAPEPRAPGLPCDPRDVDDFLSRPPSAVVHSVEELRGPVLVLGAGGKMGLHLCAMLAEAGRLSGRRLRVVAVSRFRTLRDRESFHARGIETMAADLSVAEEVARLPDAPTVFFLAGVKFGTTDAPELLETMNVTVPRLVAERYRESRIVAFSTGCIYPFVTPASVGATEATPPAPVGAYAESCLRREDAFVEAARRFGTKVVLVRLNYAVEFRYGVLVDIATAILQRQPIDVTTGYVNVIWQNDAVAQIIRAHVLAGNPPVPVNITGAEVHRVRDIAARFGALFGVPPLCSGEESATAWLSDASWSHRIFGPPPTTLETMERWIAAWLAKGESTWGKPTGFGNRDGKF